MGHRPPYGAVINLALLTAHNWRAVRSHIIGLGIGDPLEMPSMHQILDITEKLVLESFVSSDHKKDQRDREHFIDTLYRPNLEEISTDGGELAVPAGFEDGGEDSFSSFMAQAR